MTTHQSSKPASEPDPDLESVASCIAVATMASGQIILSMQPNGSIVVSARPNGTDVGLTQDDVLLFSHARGWVTDLGTALIAVTRERDALAQAMAQLRVQVLDLSTLQQELIDRFASTVSRILQRDLTDRLAFAASRILQHDDGDLHG